VENMKSIGNIKNEGQRKATLSRPQIISNLWFGKACSSNLSMNFIGSLLKKSVVLDNLFDRFFGTKSS